MVKMDYPKDAEIIVRALGGKSDTKRVLHYMTRVRVYVKKKNLAGEQSIQKLPEVTGINWNNGQFQIICGTYAGGACGELANLGVPDDDTDTGQTITNKDERIVSRTINAIVGCMAPVIPTLTTAGMIKVILALCTTFKQAPQTSNTYQAVNFTVSTMYCFLPFFIAVSAAKVFRVSQSLALLIAGVFLHPDSVKIALARAPILFFGVPVFKYDYSRSIIPVVLMVWAMPYITKLARKVSPDVIRLILEPTLIIIISIPLALLIVGLIGGILGTWLVRTAGFLSIHLGFVIVGLLAAAFPYIAMTRIHHTLTPVGLSAVTTGEDALIFISQVCLNVAQGGAALAAAVKSKQGNMKQLGSATGISASVGITEPALYGVTPRLKRPLVTATTAAGTSGLISGLLQVTLYIPQNCLLALPVFVGDREPMPNFVPDVVIVLVSFILSFVLTLVMRFEGDGRHKVILAENAIQVNESSQSDIKRVAVRTPATVCAPISGKVLPLGGVPDKIFAGKIVGDGLATNPVEGKVYVLDDGKIVSIMSIKHGIMSQTKDGIQLLTHIGTGTVNLKGGHFTARVKTGDSVKKGDLLVEFNQKVTEEEGRNLITPVIVSDSKNYQGVKPISKIDIVVGDKLLNLE